MANAFLNETIYAKTMLLLAKNELVMGRLVDGQYRNQVNDENGLTISVKRPPRFAKNDSSTLDAGLALQDIVTGSVNVAVNQYAKVHLSVGDIAWVQSFNDLMQSSVMKSAASTLAHQIDNFLETKTLGFNSWIAGTAPGTISGNATDPTKLIGTVAQASAAYTRLRANGVPGTDLSGVFTFDDAQSITGSMTSQFFPPGTNLTAIEKQKVPIIGNINWYGTQQTPNFTTGTRVQGDGATTGAAIDGANQNTNYRTVKDSNPFGQTILLKTAGNTKTYKKGEVFTIQGCFAWDWRNQVQLPFLQQFTITADATSSAGGAVTLSISPPIILQGSSDGTDTNVNTVFGTVANAPADSSFLQFAGALSTNLTVRSAFHKQAIAMVSTPLRMPDTGKAAQVRDPETGISIRYWRGSDISTGAHIHRWDCMFGAALMDNFMGTRVCGT